MAKSWRIIDEYLDDEISSWDSFIMVKVPGLTAEEIEPQHRLTKKLKSLIVMAIYLPMLRRKR